MKVNSYTTAIARNALVRKAVLLQTERARLFAQEVFSVCNNCDDTLLPGILLTLDAKERFNKHQDCGQNT